MWPQRFAFTTFRDALEIERVMRLFPAWKPHSESPCPHPPPHPPLSSAHVLAEVAIWLEDTICSDIRDGAVRAFGRVASCGGGSGAQNDRSRQTLAQYEHTSWAQWS